MSKATTLNHEKISQICKIVESGAVPETAAAYVGVTKRTLDRWLRRGRDEEKRREDFAAHIEEAQRDTVGLEIMTIDHHNQCRDEQIYYELIVALDQALAKSEIADINVVTKAAQNGDWQAAKFKLERRWSQRWGKKSSMEHTGKDGNAINVELSFADIIKQAMAAGNEEKQIEAEVKDVKRLGSGSEERPVGDPRGVREVIDLEGQAGDAAGHESAGGDDPPG